MKLSQVGVQLYTLRDFCGSASEFAKTAKRVREIGYQNVELAGAPPIPENEIVQILQGEGLGLCSSHENPNLILKNPQEVADRISKLGCKLAAYPWPADIDLKSETAVHQFARDLHHAATVLQKSGITLCYHHHAHEFERLGGKLIIDILLETALLLNAELDTFWLQTGGGESRRLVQKTQRTSSHPSSQGLWSEPGGP
jgi:sugar phosphate isomerase/epimerase